MKWVVFFLLLLPIIVAGQTKNDFENAMAKFQKFYNAGKGDSINAMFGKGWDQAKATKALWTNQDNADMLAKYGPLQSFKFIGIDKTDPNRVYVFRTVFKKGGEQATSLTLDENNMLGTFRFITTSKSIAKLIRKNNNSSTQ